MTTNLIQASTTMTNSYIRQKLHLLHTIIVLFVGCSISQSAFAQTFSVSGLPLTIPDPGNLSNTVTVSGLTGTVATADEVQINISISHAWASDIVIGITPPGGSEILIVNRIGGGTNIDMSSSNTLSFRSNASGIIPTPGLNGVIPSGVYLPTGSNPVGSFSSLVGATRNGNWTIRVRDDDGIIQGSLHKAEIQFFGLCTPVTPSVSIAASPSGSITSGTSVTFTATPTHGGTTPSYEWKKNSTNVGTNSATYTDAGLANGDIITCVMTSSDGCASPATATSNEMAMTVITCTNPTAYTVTGGGAYCAGGTGAAVGLSNSESGVTYQLKNSSGNVGSPVSGTGAAISFGIQTAGTYTVEATRTAGDCKATMAGSVTVVESAAIVFGTPTVTNVKCPGGNSGKVVISATGGTGTITYAISPNVGSQSPSGTFNNLTAQTYTFTATDANGCTKTTTAVVGTNINMPPTVTLTSPTNGATLVTNTTLTATASDPDGTISRVNFYWVVGRTKTGAASRQLIGSDNTAPYSYDWLNMVGGNYDIQAEAVDDCGDVTFSSIANVNVLETFTVLITAPTSGQGFVAGSNLTLAASVIAFANRTITKVEFFSNNVKLGEDLTAPYTYAWNNVPSGNYYLRAVATDNMGGVWYSPYTYILGINTNGGESLSAVSGLSLSHSVGNEFVLYQNQPNPAANETSIGFNLPKDGQARLTITTIDGRVVKVVNGEYKAGFNNITVNKSDLNTSGIFYYRLETAEHSASKKMVIMN